MTDAGAKHYPLGSAPVRVMNMKAYQQLMDETEECIDHLRTINTLVGMLVFVDDDWGAVRRLTSVNNVLRDIIALLDSKIEGPL